MAKGLDELLANAADRYVEPVYLLSVQFTATAKHAGLVDFEDERVNLRGGVGGALYYYHLEDDAEIILPLGSVLVAYHRLEKES